MKTIAVVNLKGGVGKTSTCLAVADGLKRRGARVLAVDLDGQCNLSFLMGASGAGFAGASVLDVLQRTTSAANAIQRTERGDIIPATTALAGADLALTQTGKEYRLREALAPLEGAYNYILVDTAPSLGVCTINALTAADGCIVATQSDFLSLQALGQLNGTISAVRQYCNSALQIYGIVITRYAGRAVINREVAGLIEDTAKALGTKAYTPYIRECIAVKEAQAVGKSIYDYAPRSNAAADYTALVGEIAKQLEG